MSTVADTDGQSVASETALEDTLTPIAHLEGRIEGALRRKYDTIVKRTVTHSRISGGTALQSWQDSVITAWKSQGTNKALWRVSMGLSVVRNSPAAKRC